MKVNCGFAALLFTAFLSLFSSCMKTNELAVNPDLAGTWQWVRTDGGIAYHIDTPASTGKSIDMVITGDYRYFIYTSGVLLSQGTYTLKMSRCIHDQKNKPVINFSSPADREMMMDNIDQSKLELSDNAEDGMSSLYSKK